MMGKQFILALILIMTILPAAAQGSPGNNTTENGADAYWLTIDSFPVTGVEIGVSTADTAGHENGTTHFTRSYISGTVVTLTAPETVNGESFLKWVVDVEETKENSVTITISENHIARAEYSTPPGMYPLVVRSFPITAVNVTVSPNDYYGSGSGFTYFTNTYSAWTKVTLTAPALINGRNFVKWDVHGNNNLSRTVTVTMIGYRSLVAVYDPEPETYNLDVKTFPAAGANISVSPADNNSFGNGYSNFSRNYNVGTVVTVTAPNAFNGMLFTRWNVDGTDVTGISTTVNMSSGHSLVAVYQQATGTHKLKIRSHPYTGVNVTVSPADSSGSANGSTYFDRYYYPGTSVTLIAPAVHYLRNFIKWNIGGNEYFSKTVTINMNSDLQAIAVYDYAIDISIGLNRPTLYYGWSIGGKAPLPRVVRVAAGNSSVNWEAESDVDWLQFSPDAETGTAEMSVSVNPEGLSEGRYTGKLTVTALEDVTVPQTVDVVLNVHAQNATTGPVGQFATPVDGSNVFSSIPVTGWVVDDVGVENVKIYRENGSGRENDKHESSGEEIGSQKALVYIGDAVFVEGARPDVEALYPEYPQNYQAGWGYMLLTHFLPNGGNGTFTLHAIATDVEGNAVTLGTKTITVDNANAVKPFGAIDTPTQGGTASGSSFLNWGWVLTPQPNSILTDGSTIDVFLDGVNLGNPIYNIYREDIAALFPGYANSEGAVGYFYLDTTEYEDGVHTIQWVARDSAGNTDGIGSRYFSIDNSGVSRSANQSRMKQEGWAPVGLTGSDKGVLRNAEFQNIERIPVDFSQPVSVIRGFDDDSRPGILPSAADGTITIEMKELERLVISFPSGSGYIGYTVTGSRLRALPAGSMLDRRTGIFSWQAGVGFVGEYKLVFIRTAADGAMTRQNVTVNIAPKF